MNKQDHPTRGQAFLEFILVLPILFFLIIFGLQIFKSIYEAQYKEELAREKILASIDWEANGGPKSHQVVAEEISSPIETQGLPFLGGAAEGSQGISIKIGMCRELKGDCE